MFVLINLWLRRRSWHFSRQRCGPSARRERAQWGRIHISLTCSASVSRRKLPLPEKTRTKPICRQIHHLTCLSLFALNALPCSTLAAHVPPLLAPLFLLYFSNITLMFEPLLVCTLRISRIKCNKPREICIVLECIIDITCSTTCSTTCSRVLWLFLPFCNLACSTVRLYSNERLDANQLSACMAQIWYLYINAQDTTHQKNKNPARCYFEQDARVWKNASPTISIFAYSLSAYIVDCRGRIR